MSASMLHNSVLAAQIAETPAYKAMLIEFEAKAKEALVSGVFYIESLGSSLTLPQVAQVYQGLKSVGGWFFDNNETTRKASFAYAVSQECFAVIKGAGYKADAKGIHDLIAFA